MKSPDINAVIAQFDTLPYEEKEVAAEIIRKAYAEAAREMLASRAKQAVRDLKAGKVKRGGVKELRKDLEG